MTQNQQPTSQSKQQARRRGQPRRRKRRTQARALALFLLLIGIKRVRVFLTNPIFEVFDSTETQAASCDPTVTSVFVFVLNREDFPTQPVAININAATAGTVPKFIPDGSNVKQYPAYEVGSDCKVHSAVIDIKIPVFVLYIENNGNSGPTDEKCKVSRIFTKGALTNCGGSKTDLDGGVLTFLDRTGSVAPNSAFTSIRRDSTTKFYNGYVGRHFVIERTNPGPFTFAHVDDAIVEIFLMSLAVSFNDLPVMVVNYDVRAGVNDYLSLNTDPWAKPINFENAAKRMINDDFPGYYLDVHNGAGDDDSKILRKKITRYGPSGTTVSLYIQKPLLLVQGETHTIEIVERYYRTASNQRASTRGSNYQIEVTRTATQIEFRVKRNNVAIPALFNDKPLPTMGNFIFFAINFASGCLYFTSDVNCRAKTHEFFNVYEFGETHFVTYNAFAHDASIAEILGDDRVTISSVDLYTTVEYKPPAGVTSNVARFKVVDLNRSEGVVPPPLVVYPQFVVPLVHCYLRSVTYGGRLGCLAMIHIGRPNDQSFSYIDHNSQIQYYSSGPMTSSCRVFYGNGRCLSPMPGYISNLEVLSGYPLPNGGNMAVADYNTITSQRTKDFFIEVTNNLGTKYLFGCPESCGTCNAKLECTSCLDGSPVGADKKCPLTNCAGITNCVKCNTGGKCGWCSFPNKLQPDRLSCATGACPALSNYPDTFNTLQCDSCDSPKCKTCSNLPDICEECVDPTHRLLAEADKASLPSGQTFIGKKDCFSQTLITDFFYTDAMDFKRCRPNCKKCTNGNDCQECGNQLDPTISYYLEQSTPANCFDSSQCSLANNRFKFPGLSPPACLSCSAGESYLEGSNPPQCTSCNTGGVFVETTTRICKPCNTGCSSCTSATSCQPCTNPNHYVQPDGTCQAICPSGKKGVDGTPRTCQSCSAECTDCQHTGCQACQSGFEVKDGECVKSQADKKNLEVVESSYIDAPSRLRLIFNQEIESKVTPNNVEIELTKTNSEEKIETTVTEVKTEQSKKGIKIYFEAKTEGIEDGKISASFKQPNLILAEGDPERPYPAQKIESQDRVSYYRPETQVTAARALGTASNLITLLLGVAALIFTYSSLLDLIKTFQTLDFLVYYNVDHPSNLQAFLESIELTILENLPNPLKNFKDDLCYIEKAKFEEDGVTCYMLSDQGRYLTFTVIVFLYSVILRGISKFCKGECLKNYINNNFGAGFWVDFLEAIRFEIFVVVLISLGKIDLIGENVMSKFTVNIIASIIFSTLNIFIVVKQFLNVKKNYLKYKKKKSLAQNSQREHENVFAEPEKNQYLKESKKGIFDSSSRVNEKNPLNQKKAIFDEKIEKKEEKNQEKKSEQGQEDEEEYKIGCFYQRNHNPLNAIKEIFIITAVVSLYEWPVVQTLSVTATLAIFVSLDWYYKPFTDQKDNKDLLVIGNLFLLISVFLSSLSFTHHILSRKTTFYFIGYPAIFLISLLIIWNIIMLIRGISEGIKNFFRKNRKRAKVDQRGERNVVNRSQETPEIGQFGQDSLQLVKDNIFDPQKQNNNDEENQDDKMKQQKLDFLDVGIEEVEKNENERGEKSEKQEKSQKEEKSENEEEKREEVEKSQKEVKSEKVKEIDEWSFPKNSKISKISSNRRSLLMGNEGGPRIFRPLKKKGIVFSKNNTMKNESEI